MKELEKVQNRAARFETGSLTSILEQLVWESLHKRRIGSKLILLFKGLNDRASIPCELKGVESLRTSHWALDTNLLCCEKFCLQRT